MSAERTGFSLWLASIGYWIDASQYRLNRACLCCAPWSGVAIAAVFRVSPRRGMETQHDGFGWTASPGQV